MLQLHNIHPVETKVGEVGLTARRGMKWFSVHPEEKIELCSGTVDKQEVVGHGEVIEKWSGIFSNIPARLIEQEHEISSRNYSGLLASMRRAYGDDFKENEVVVLFSYRRLD